MIFQLDGQFIQQEKRKKREKKKGFFQKTEKIVIQKQFYCQDNPSIERTNGMG